MKQIFTLLLVSLMLCSCATTSVISSWKHENSTSLTMKKILVVGLMGEREPELREATERTVAQALTNSGIYAVARIDAIGAPLKDMMANNDLINNELKENGYDGVMLVSLISKDKNIDVNVYHPGYYGWHGPYLAPGTIDPVSISTEYMLEANLYTVTPDKLMYSVLTKSFEQASPKRLSKKFANAVIQDMQKQRLVQQTK